MAWTFSCEGSWKREHNKSTIIISVPKREVIDAYWLMESQPASSWLPLVFLRRISKSMAMATCSTNVIHSAGVNVKCLQFLAQGREEGSLPFLFQVLAQQTHHCSSCRDVGETESASLHSLRPAGRWGVNRPKCRKSFCVLSRLWAFTLCISGCWSS